MIIIRYKNKRENERDESVLTRDYKCINKFIRMLEMNHSSRIYYDIINLIVQYLMQPVLQVCAIYLIIHYYDYWTLNSIILAYPKRNIYIIRLSVQIKKRGKNAAQINITVQIFRRDREANLFRFCIEILAICTSHTSISFLLIIGPVYSPVI